MVPPAKIKVRDFHVVGGGCFGSQYTRWLLRAQNLGWLDFEHIWIIDKNRDCLAARENLCGGAVQLKLADWVEYFSRYLQDNYQVPSSSADHWVPSPLSPHILFLGFLRAGEWKTKESYEIREFREDVPTPVRIPLPVGSLAVSFAEWKCPVNCIEPPNCPAIQKKRHWDMKGALERYFLKNRNNDSIHVLQCQHLVHGVGTIPCQDIFNSFNVFLEDAAGHDKREMVLATVSGCHGLIGRAILEKKHP
jgi:hypothetical protein